MSVYNYQGEDIELFVIRSIPVGLTCDSTATSLFILQTENELYLTNRGPGYYSDAYIITFTTADELLVRHIEWLQHQEVSEYQEVNNYYEEQLKKAEEDRKYLLEKHSKKEVR